jgi:hypothetical protein
MKYVIARCKNTGTRVSLVFSERITHRDCIRGYASGVRCRVSRVRVLR